MQLTPQENTALARALFLASNISAIRDPAAGLHPDTLKEINSYQSIKLIDLEL